MKRQKELILGRFVLRFLDHGEAISPLVIFDLVHDVVNEQHAAARRLKEILWIERIGNVVDVKALSLILDGEASFLF